MLRENAFKLKDGGKRIINPLEPIRTLPRTTEERPWICLLTQGYIAATLRCSAQLPPRTEFCGAAFGYTAALME